MKPDPLDQALQLFQANRLVEARQVVNAVLQREPAHAGALHMLATLEAQEGRLDQALAVFDRALQLVPGSGPMHMDRGNVLMLQGKVLEAKEAYLRAMRLNPSQAEVYSNLGQVERQLGNTPEAIGHFEMATRVNPQFVDAWFGLGDAQFDMGDYENAAKSYARTLALKPLHIEALLNRGTTLINLQRYTEAVGHFDRIISLLPEHADAHARRGNALIQLKQHRKGLESLERALSLTPGNPDWLTWKGHALQGLARYAEAFKAYEEALRIFPDNPWAIEGIGGTCHRLDRYEEASAHFDRALELVPNNPGSLLNRGNAKRELRDYAGALTDFEKAIEIDPEFGSAHFNRAVILLKTGRWSEAWPEYEWRWKYSQAPDPRTQPQGLPRWDGSTSLVGKKILLTHEQGLGDTLQFVRYATEIASRGAEVWLWLPKPLTRVMQSVASVAGILDRDAPHDLKTFDFYCPLMTLPGIVGTTPQNIPSARQSYLSAAPELIDAWKKRLGERRKGARVGLMWRGHPNPNLPERSVSLAALEPLLALPCEFVSLQKDLELVDLEEVTRRGISHFGTEQQDFADAAAMIDNCDLVVTIDTSVAHLAGALGTETWVILPYAADWRWLDDRDDCLWYPTVKLFRQPTFGDWATPISKLAGELQRRLG